MRMVQRKQDALSTNFLLGLLEKEEEKEIRVDVRKAPRVRGDQSLSHLANRIEDEIRVTTPEQRARHVLANAGITTPQLRPTHTINSHLQHVGQRSRKIPLTTKPERRVRRVKKQPEPVVRKRSPRGPPPATRSRPAVGMEDEVRRSARDKTNSKGKRHKRRRRFLR
ncbi:hypothetical protein N9L11_02690 [Euryarchaeota archaeon]|nr:hypothetical protein [Euryarchaeota archaeon]